MGKAFLVENCFVLHMNMLDLLLSIDLKLVIGDIVVIVDMFSRTNDPDNEEGYAC